MDTLAHRLRYARERMGLSQSELARRAGLRPQAIQFIEAGRVQRPRNLLDLAQVLAVNAEWLLFGRGPVEAGVREPQGPYETPSGGLSSEAAAIGRLWMTLPVDQQTAIAEVLRALAKRRQ